jgi:hypothetical protein
MKYILLLTTIIVMAACSGRSSYAATSPSGQYTVRTEISGDEAGPTRRLCVRLRLTDNRTNKEIIFQTGASDVQKWAMNWSPTNTLVLYSSDIGIHSYEVHDGAITERIATPEEQEIGRAAYEKKYGKRPRA